MSETEASAKKGREKISTARATSESTMIFLALKRSRKAPPIQLVTTRGKVVTAMTPPMWSTDPVRW